MPLPFIIGIGAAIASAGTAAAATIGTAAAATAATAATVGTAAAATVGTAAATVGAAATSTAGMAAIGTAATVGGAAHMKKKIEDAEYDAYKRGVRTGEYGKEQLQEAHAKEIEAKDNVIGYMNDQIEKKDEYIQVADDFIDANLGVMREAKKSISERLLELQSLYNQNLISVEEFEHLKVHILKEI